MRDGEAGRLKVNRGGTGNVENRVRVRSRTAMSQCL